MVLAEQLGVQVRQLDGVPDLVDLVAQAADVLVRDVGDLLEDELLDLGLGDPLVDEAGARVDQQPVADPHLVLAQGVRDPGHPLLVGVPDDQHAVLAEDLLELDDLADPLEAAGLDDVQRLVQQHLAAGDQVLLLHRRAHRDAHLAAHR